MKTKTYYVTLRGNNRSEYQDLEDLAYAKVSEIPNFKAGSLSVSIQQIDSTSLSSDQWDSYIECDFTFYAEDRLSTY